MINFQCYTERNKTSLSFLVYYKLLSRFSVRHIGNISCPSTVVNVQQIKLLYCDRCLTINRVYSQIILIQIIRIYVTTLGANL
jgi:hypothetical protein